jgi:hypothetical protein
MGNWWNCSDRNRPKNSEKSLFQCHKVHIDWPLIELGSPSWDVGEWKPAHSGRAYHCNMMMWRTTFKVTFVNIRTILSTHRPCSYLCTISRPERSLQYRRCCTFRQAVRSEPALRLWCAALHITPLLSYQWRPCAPVRRPLSPAAVISETWPKRIREFCGIVIMEGSRTLIVAYSECFLLPVLLKMLWNNAGNFLLRSGFFMKLLRIATRSDKFQYALQ